jgi:hypothetical protein
MHGPINVIFPNKTSKWQMGFNSAFKGLSFHRSLRSVTTAVEEKSLNISRINVNLRNLSLTPYSNSGLEELRK